MPPMFSSLTSYIWGDVADEAAAAEPNTAAVRRTPSPRRKCTLKTSSEDNEWVLVENSSRDSSPEQGASSFGCRPQRSCHFPAGPGSATGFTDCQLLTPTDHQAVLGGAQPSTGRRPSPPDVMHSSQSDACSDVSTLPDVPGVEESFLVTPPPCFTASALSAGGLGSSVETGSMEDLLIEHPSMSVYQARGRQNSGDIDSSHSEDSEDVPPTIPTVATRGAHAARHPPRRPRAVAQRAGLSATAIGAIGARYRTRSITRSALSRNNQVVVSHQAGKHAARRGRIVQPGARCMRKC